MSCGSCKRKKKVTKSGEVIYEFNDPFILRLLLFVIFLISTPILVLAGVVLFFKYSFIDGEFGFDLGKNKKDDDNTDDKFDDESEVEYQTIYEVEGENNGKSD